MEGKEIVVDGVGQRAATVNGACADVPASSQATEALAGC
jgi:hypothetical protein